MRYKIIKKMSHIDKYRNAYEYKQKIKKSIYMQESIVMCNGNRAICQVSRGFCVSET
jgi:hypothetical protein